MAVLVLYYVNVAQLDFIFSEIPSLSESGLSLATKEIWARFGKWKGGSSRCTGRAVQGPRGHVAPASCQQSTSCRTGAGLQLPWVSGSASPSPGPGVCAAP